MTSTLTPKASRKWVSQVCSSRGCVFSALTYDCLSYCSRRPPSDWKIICFPSKFKVFLFKWSLFLTSWSFRSHSTTSLWGAVDWFILSFSSLWPFRQISRKQETNHWERWDRKNRREKRGTGGKETRSVQSQRPVSFDVFEWATSSAVVIRHTQQRGLPPPCPSHQIPPQLQWIPQLIWNSLSAFSFHQKCQDHSRAIGLLLSWVIKLLPRFFKVTVVISIFFSCSSGSAVFPLSISPFLFRHNALIQFENVSISSFSEFAYFSAFFPNSLPKIGRMFLLFGSDRNWFKTQKAKSFEKASFGGIYIQ